MWGWSEQFQVSPYNIPIFPQAAHCREFVEHRRPIEQYLFVFALCQPSEITARAPFGHFNTSVNTFAPAYLNVPHPGS